jgi:hypothetical protein
VNCDLLNLRSSSLVWFLSVISSDPASGQSLARSVTDFHRSTEICQKHSWNKENTKIDKYRGFHALEFVPRHFHLHLSAFSAL